MAIKNTIRNHLSGKKNKNNLTAKIAALSMFMAGAASFSGCTGEGSKSNSKQSCYDDYDCPSLERCVNSYCESPSNEPFNIKTATTDQEGKAYFTDTHTGEKVSILVLNDNNELVKNSTVLYVDGNGFEFFRAEHPDYTIGAVHAYDHNSEHIVRLTASPLQVIENGKDFSSLAVNNYLNNYPKGDYLGCWNEEEIMKAIESGSIMLKIESKIFSLGFDNNYVDKIEEWAKDKWPSSYVGHKWLLGGGNLATAKIWVVQPSPLEDEIQGDGIDNNCNGEIDEENSSTGQCEETWVDPDSNIMWQKYSNRVFLPECSVDGSIYNFQPTFLEAITYCQELTWAGYNDWHLPSISELRTLVRGWPATESGGSCKVTDQCLWYLDDCFKLPDCQWSDTEGNYCPKDNLELCSTKHFSSSEVKGEINEVWSLDFKYARIASSFKSAPGAARCVR
ncbi:MAG: DUF1566 domain-containing protein [Nanoarchaeota archaeon]|nr:DUF1566 domain-containing protein [Nanoarchaeota archaeon]MBU1632554.1 DUF1566 domain-containing protein [Nanoarchaeota archaeon]MBU1876573.1 DUF1566 domain-containing protein [Nanoarchaeota archaeon]